MIAILLTEDGFFLFKAGLERLWCKCARSYASIDRNIPLKSFLRLSQVNPSGCRIRH